MSAIASDILILHIAVSFIMTGAMWFVQIAYYPNLACVGRDAFVGYQQEHIRRVTRIAWIMLALELLSAVVLAILPPDPSSRWPLVANTLMVAAVWWSTFAIQVPLHKRLEQGWEDESHARLVSTNWFRTVLYSLRGILLIVVLAQNMG